ncbi:MAG TPA: DsbC family protein [Casimicrobiaceae bacterium]|jgi:thiol:disulfide interchange protein DsbC
MPFPLTATLRQGAATLALGLALALPSAQTLADEPKPTSDAAAVKKALEQKFPGATISNVSKTSYFGGLYEAMVEDKLVYTDRKVDYVIVGAIYDANSKTNLTEARQRKLNRVAIDKLPMDLAFKRVKGDGSRKLILFSDADCPFCHRLEEEMKSVDNVTIYTFLFPIDQLHPDAARKSKQIWCAPDKQKAWNDFFANGTVPDNAGDCGDPVAKTQALGASLHIAATPTLIFEDGSMQPGALPAAQIEQELVNASAEAKKIAANQAASGAAQTK